jgi:serine phosphatase RsbU (regulator of sigma subunit)
VLPKAEKFYSLFSESFIFSKARDIVSGDFFWVHDKGDKQIAVLADCSGHGVPGAFMSIIGNDLLDTIIACEGEDRPAVILQKLEDRLISALQNGGKAEDVKDGMDLGVCVIDKAKHKMSFSGAYRSLFFRDSKGNFQEIPGNPFSIGGGVNGRRKDFKLETFTFEPGTTFYMSSDGYYSQFGGPEGKKFMKSRFRDTLAEISEQPVEQQKENLSKIFNEWQGSNEQVDDVLVLGFVVR